MSVKQVRVAAIVTAPIDTVRAAVAQLSGSVTTHVVETGPESW